MANTTSGTATFGKTFAVDDGQGGEVVADADSGDVVAVADDDGEQCLQIGSDHRQPEEFQISRYFC